MLVGFWTYLLHLAHGSQGFADASRGPGFRFASKGPGSHEVFKRGGLLEVGILEGEHSNLSAALFVRRACFDQGCETVAFHTDSAVGFYSLRSAEAVLQHGCKVVLNGNPPKKCLVSFWFPFPKAKE